MDGDTDWRRGRRGRFQTLQGDGTGACSGWCPTDRSGCQSLKAVVDGSTDCRHDCVLRVRTEDGEGEDRLQEMYRIDRMRKQFLPHSDRNQVERACCRVSLCGSGECILHIHNADHAPPPSPDESAAYLLDEGLDGRRRTPVANGDRTGAKRDREADPAVMKGFAVDRSGKPARRVLSGWLLSQPPSTITNSSPP